MKVSLLPFGFLRFAGASRELKRMNSVLERDNKPAFLDSDLGDEIDKIKGIMRDCELCEHKCGVNRIEGETGRCGIEEPSVRTITIRGEEVTRCALFLPGCNLSCSYCANWGVSQYCKGRRMNVGDLVDKVIRMEGDVILQLVGGEPSINLLYILKVLRGIKEKIKEPKVWVTLDTNMYMTKKALTTLNEVVDIYLSDFKFGNDECATKIAKVRNYFEIVARNNRIVHAAGKNLWLNHLILPNHIECCGKPILDWVSKEFGSEVPISLFTSYFPCWKAKENPKLNREVREDEYLELKNYAEDLGLNLLQ